MDKTEPTSDFRPVLTRIAGGETIRPGDDPSADAATKAGLIEQDPKGHLTLTARGRHLVDG